MNDEKLLESRKRRRQWFWWTSVVVSCLFAVLVIVLFLPSPADKAFRWFSGLDFPDVRGCRFVRVFAGHWSQSGNLSPQAIGTEGFLLGQSNASFTVLTKDLFIRTLEVRTNGLPEHQQIKFEELDLRKEAEAALRLLQDPRKDTWQRFGQRLEERTEVFVLAWACERNGHPDLAESLYNQASAMREEAGAGTAFWLRLLDNARRLLKRPPNKIDMIEQLQNDLGNAIMWRAVEAFGDPSVSRRELLGRFQSIKTDYPTYQQIPRVMETITILEQMVQEDDVHARRPPEDSRQMTRDERVAELIFQLRDQNGRQIAQPGWCDIFLDPREGNSPAHQLVKLGNDAVPQLIGAIEDRRFSRSVGFHRDYFFSHHVLSVGDCAQSILQQIAGRTFYSPGTTASYMSLDGNAQGTKAEAQAWWQDMQKKGEKQLLIEGTERGNDDSPNQARLLLERYSDAALPAVIKGSKNADKDWIRDDLVAVAARISGDDSTKFLLAELDSGPHLRSCVTAAQGLLERGREEAVEQMIKKWRQADSLSIGNDSSDVEKLIAFLADCNRPEAIDALGASLIERDVGLRLSVVSAFDQGGNLSTVSDGGPGLNPSGRTAPLSAGSLTAAERLLVKALEDTERRFGISGTWADKSFEDPRICDIAGHVLSRRWPEKYSFDLEAPRKQAELQRFECMNLWRKQNGMPLLALPEPKKVLAASPQAIQPLLEGVRAAKANARTRQLLLGLEEMGVPALVDTHKLVQDLPASHPARADLVALERRLACVVTEVCITQNSLPASPWLLKLFAQLTNAPLTAEKYIAVLVSFANAPAGEPANLQLLATRDDDLSGITIEITLAGGRFSQPRTQKGWSVHERVRLGKDGVHSASRSSSVDHGASKEAYSDLATAAAQALGSPPQTPFVISVSLSWQEQ